MFDIGFSELLVIALVALVVLGPERLPKAARLAGMWIRRARMQWQAVKSELENELADDDMRRSILRARDELREAQRRCGPTARGCARSSRRGGAHDRCARRAAGDRRAASGGCPGRRLRARRADGLASDRAGAAATQTPVDAGEWHDGSADARGPSTGAATRPAQPRTTQPSDTARR